MGIRFRSRVLPFGIFGVVVLAIVAAVAILPSRAGATRHQHLKGDLLPPGTIDGRRTPEAIPDAVAYGLLFRTLQTLSEHPENAAAYQSYLEFVMGLDAKDPDGRGSEQANFRRVVERFSTQIWRLDLEVARIKEVWRTTGRRQRDPVIEKQIQELEARRQAVLSTIVADLPRDLGIRGAEKVRNVMLDRVRRHSKLYVKGVAK